MFARFALALALALSALSCSAPAPAPAPAPVNVPDGTCHEDMPCWDCETMGNHVCGPALRGIPAAGHDAWRECFADLATTNLTATELASECDAEVLANL